MHQIFQTSTNFSTMLEGYRLKDSLALVVDGVASIEGSTVFCFYVERPSFVILLLVSAF